MDERLPREPIKPKDEPLFMNPSQHADDGLFNLFPAGHALEAAEASEPDEASVTPIVTEPVEPRVSEAWHSLGGNPSKVVDLETKRALAHIGAASKGMRADIARADDRVENELLYGLSGPLPPLSPAENAARLKRIAERDQERIDAKVKQYIEQEGMPYEKAHDRAVAEMKAARRKRESW